MPSLPPPTESTRLENLNFAPSGVQFDLQGQTVWIKKETDGPSVAALRALYATALAASPKPRDNPGKPGWLARLGSWIGRLLRGRDPRGPEPPPEQGGPSPKGLEAPAPLRAGRTAAVRGPEPAPAADVENAAEAARSRPLPARAAGPAAPPPAGADEPLLRAVFADRGGVHLIWQRTRPGLEPENDEKIYALDSKVAASLQDCYGHLARLGYKVVGLDMKPLGPAEPEKAPAEAAPERSATSPRPEKTPVTPKTLVMRLHPEASDQPDRALVSPVDNAENTQVLVAPERLLRSLRTAADPAKPVENRLTYLRCSSGKSGLKVVEVGFGEGRENTPARWTDVAQWSAQQAETAVAKKSAPLPAPLRPTGPELEFSA